VPAVLVHNVGHGDPAPGLAHAGEILAPGTESESYGVWILASLAADRAGERHRRGMTSLARHAGARRPPPGRELSGITATARQSAALGSGRQKGFTAEARYARSRSGQHGYRRPRVFFSGFRPVGYLPLPTLAGRTGSGGAAGHGRRRGRYRGGRQNPVTDASSGRSTQLSGSPAAGPRHTRPSSVALARSPLGGPFHMETMPAGRRSQARRKARALLASSARWRPAAAHRAISSGGPAPAATRRSAAVR
jgi:hypothetical protein